MVDASRVRGLLSTLVEYHDRLSSLSGLPRDQYVQDEAFAGRYLVQAAAQTCIDIANHLIASEGWRVPRDFRDAFTVLEERGVLDAPLAGRLRALAGLRNRLVHLYSEVDDGLVYDALQAGLNDLSQFAARVAAYLGKTEGQ